MTDTTAPAAARMSEDRAPIGFVEFVTLIAAMMALTALGIDSMLPALPAIGASLGVTEANDRQFVVSSFLFGFGIAQLAYGPLTDRFGRRPMLIVALGGYVLANLLAALAGSFVLLLVARVVSGAFIGGARTVTVALVRDCFAGRAMARVMSLAFIVFMAAPVIAPTFGQLVLVFAEWRWIFGGIALVAAAILTWFLSRMPETLAVADRRPLDPGPILAGFRRAATDRVAIGYTLAATALSGGLYGFINSIQQVMADVFHQPSLLTAVFAGVAGTMALGSLVNSRIVMRVGTRPISHSALVGFVLFAALHLGFALSGYDTLVSFAIVQALMMACFGLAASNFSSMAMERMGDIAGTASSFQGFVSTFAGALIGVAIGQSFDGTTVPLYLGFLGAGVIALGIVALTERGRLFRPQQGMVGADGLEPPTSSV